MTRVLIGLDDTDRSGAKNSTARLARRLGEALASRAGQFLGTVGHILCPGVAATTNNKASCIVLEGESHDLDALLSRSAAFVAAEASPGARPGLVVVASEGADALICFAEKASAATVSLSEARALAAPLRHWSASSGEGLIGALAAAGLTARGWSGRWLEWGCALRSAERALTVAELAALGIGVVSIETDAEVPKPDDIVDTLAWLRPQLLGGRPILPLRRAREGVGWEALAVKAQAPFRSRNGPASDLKGET
ncbi:hypothetical protein SAMN06265338_12713 [Rhodoblastus acidophilus]|uniref:DUF1743 domain-containing protein n=1 Tax=Rhodoblastus acidophilus TaxID=1074 RepID=A0A212SDW0_RHOAC|nr:hypothetical protein [Rhodoblastus acidophilus]SNB83541.1 hypothetical protein SAMN06265338_12713 [Rhodoblastus acidophilus]